MTELNSQFLDTDLVAFKTSYNFHSHLSLSVRRMSCAKLQAIIVNHFPENVHRKLVIFAKVHQEFPIDFLSFTSSSKVVRKDKYLSVFFRKV